MDSANAYEIPSHITKIVVDGANVAFASRDGNKADIANLKILLSQLRLIQKANPQIRYEVICDASLKHKITDTKRYERWLQSGAICQAPGYITADKFIIALMKKYDGKIMVISNDLFRDHPEMKELNHRIQFGFIVAFGEIIFQKLDLIKDSAETFELSINGDISPHLKIRSNILS